MAQLVQHLLCEQKAKFKPEIHQNLKKEIDPIQKITKAKRAGAWFK
jgi:hypothetical protein